MENISSVIQSVQQDMINSNNEERAALSAERVANREELQDLNTARSEKKGQMAASGVSDKRRLQIQQGLHATDALIEGVRKRLNLGLNAKSSLSDQDQEIYNQLVAIMNDIDGIKTKVTQESSEVSSLDPNNSSEVEALNAVQSASDLAEAAKTQDQISQSYQLQDQHQQQKSSVANQLDKLKKSKFFKFLTSIFKPLLEKGLQALAAGTTGGTTSALVNQLISKGLDLLESLLHSKLAQSILKESQLREKIQQFIQDQRERLADRMAQNTQQTQNLEATEVKLENVAKDI